MALVDWQPPELETSELISPTPAEHFAALLNLRSEPLADGDPLPPLWHWLYFLEWPLQEELGADGHPEAGGFLPPIKKRRRMFAGGRIAFHQPLRYGDVATRRSRVLRSETKKGRSGTLHFVTVEHRFEQAGRPLLVEEQDLVYRSATGPAAPAAKDPAPNAIRFPERSSPWQLRWCLDPVLLFRFSALTANAHRIHYDLPYARDVEGFPGLVVHGPLLTLLLMETVRRCGPPRRVATLSFRAARPTFAGEPILIHGGPEADGSCRLLVEGHDALPRLTADIEFGQASEATNSVS